MEMYGLRVWKRLYKSTDGGSNFDSTNSFGFIYVEINKLYVNDSMLVFRSNTTESQLFYSTDYGAIWQNKNISILSINGNNEYIIAGTYKNIIYSTNKFLSIDSISYPKDFYGYVKEIGFDGNGKLFFGTSSQGLYEMDFIVGIDENIHIQPIDFEVYDLYPNPFNSNVNLIYNLPYSSEIKISVNNVLGERMSVNEFFRYAGNNYEQISFDGLVAGFISYQLNQEIFLR